MLEKGKILIEIDLNQFKLHIRKEDLTELSLHFDSPSRRFYLSIIALVTNELKKLGKVTSIALEDHYETLALLNETIGNRAGSSERKKLLQRIYRKWKEALPDLEHAPLFTIPGRRKEYGGSSGKTYQFTDEEKDAWANLFEYKGSHENVRLRFSIDRLGVSLDQVDITYGEEPDIDGEYSWDRFLDSLKGILSDSESKDRRPVASTPGKRSWLRPWPRWSLLGVVGLLLVGLIVAIWYFSFHKTESASDGFLFTESPLPLPDKPSIAVLPFTNMSDDPRQEYIVDGWTDDLITDLSKISGLFVIARNSVFQYKGKSVDVKQVGRELGVRHVLEGSVRKAGDQIRINAQLTDATTGGHLWAERYDGKIEDTFELQDDITGKIVNALAVKLAAREREQVTRKETDNIEAYDAYLKGREHYVRHTPDDFKKADYYYKKAVELDPNYGRAYAALSSLYWVAEPGWLETRWPQTRVLAAHFLESAMKNPNANAYAISAYIKSWLRYHKEAISEAQQALNLAPNDPGVLGTMSAVLYFAGRPEEAIEFANLAMRKDPSRVYTALYHLGMAHFSLQKYEQATTYFERSYNHGYTWALPLLAATYAHLGRMQEARESLNKSRWRGLKLPHYMLWFQFKEMTVSDRLAEGLLKAGMRDGFPPGYYKIFEENRLSGDKIKELLSTGQVLGAHHTNSWVEGDMLCSNAEISDGEYTKVCYPIYRNPGGTIEKRDSDRAKRHEYLTLEYTGIFPWSPIN